MSWLEVHVFGARPMGEGIIVKFPDGRHAVIDCCYRAGTSAPNPMVEFLRQRNVRVLAFACLTHPHEDHYCGMLEVLKFAPPAQYFRSGAMTPSVLRKIVMTESNKALEFGDASRQRSINYLQELDRWLQKNSKEIRIGRASIATRIYPFLETKSPSFAVKAISPCGSEIKRYEDSLSECFNDDSTLKETVPDLKHNIVSMGLLIQCRKFSVILGGDVEQKNWRETLLMFDKNLLASRLVKVSHHCSKTGLCDNLWETLTFNTKTIAVTTSWRSKLPNRDVINHISKFAESVYCTNKDSLPPRRSSLAGFFSKDSHLHSLCAGFSNVANVGEDCSYGQCSFYFSRDGKLERLVADSPAGKLDCA